MSLEDELKTLSGRKRQFLLLRVVDIDTEAARQLCGISKGTYNSWLHNRVFTELYQKRSGFAAEYRQEALKLIRRGNQLKAVLLEEKIIAKIEKEVVSGKYDLLKTNLAREVYSKLISDLDYQPKAISLTWQQRVQQLTTNEPAQIEGGEIVDGEVTPLIAEGEVANVREN